MPDDQRGNPHVRLVVANRRVPLPDGGRIPEYAVAGRDIPFHDGAHAHVEVGRAFRCSEGQLWANIVIPASLPFIVTGLRLALGRGLIGMVLADLYTAISGIGYLIVRTASTYQVDKMFVPIVTLGLLGVTLTALLRLAERYVAPWTAAADES